MVVLWILCGLLLGAGLICMFVAIVLSYDPEDDEKVRLLLYLGFGLIVLSVVGGIVGVVLS